MIYIVIIAITVLALHILKQGYKEHQRKLEREYDDSFINSVRDDGYKINNH